MKAYTAYLIWVEDASDYYFSPEGVCVITDDQSYTVYSLDSRHNFLRSAVLKFPITQLLEPGITFRGAHIKLEDLASFREKQGLSDAPVHELLRALYHENEERHFYLYRHAR